jgi:hypothetical protein
MSPQETGPVGEGAQGLFRTGEEALGGPEPADDDHVARS